MNVRQIASSPSSSGRSIFCHSTPVGIERRNRRGKFEDRTIVLNKSITLAGKKGRCCCPA